jgi:hypothetical protein
LPLLAVWLGVKQAFYYVCRFPSGCFMSTYYQVYSIYKFSGSKPQLVSLSLHSTTEYFPFLVGSNTSLLSHSRFFHTVPEAEHYISYLFSRYPKCGLPRPVLDAQQFLLF